ncbi:phospholipase A [Candidatus Sororendozoicomonas aggregata]|uniref:phospholipase A n=1 Tax=Candidatus Sororendozoicomonas aggregata TaxID=3073239 RepID=UPI002ED01C4A
MFIPFQYALLNDAMWGNPRARRQQWQLLVARVAGGSGKGFVASLLFVLYSHYALSDENFLKIAPYRNNYLLLANYTETPDFQCFDRYNPNDKPIDSIEVEFQLSLKTLVTKITAIDGDCYLAYTQRSFWQAYQPSAYFRDTSYQPEVFITVLRDKQWRLWQLTGTDIGFVHQSNGLGGERERSWNRLYIRQHLEKGRWLLEGQVAVRINAMHNYNKDIVRYLGNDVFSVSYTSGRKVFSFACRNTVSSNFSRGAQWLSWSFPIVDDWRINGYIQAFSGYGQTLSGYEHYTNAIGVGFQFTGFFW